MYQTSSGFSDFRAQSLSRAHCWNTYHLLRCTLSLVRGDLNKVFNKRSQISLLPCHWVSFFHSNWNSIYNKFTQYSRGRCIHFKMFSCNLDLISWHFEYCQKFFHSGVDWLFQQQILKNICRIKPTDKNIYVTVFSCDIRGHSVLCALHLLQELWPQRCSVEGLSSLSSCLVLPFCWFKFTGCRSWKIQ